MATPTMRPGREAATPFDPLAPKPALTFLLGVQLALHQLNVLAQVVELFHVGERDFDGGDFVFDGGEAHGEGLVDGALGGGF